MNVTSNLERPPVENGNRAKLNYMYSGKGRERNQKAHQRPLQDVYLLLLSHGLNAGEGSMAVLARHDCLSRNREAQRGNLAAKRQRALWVAAAT